MGLRVLAPDINASEWLYTGEGRCLRMGFMQLKGLRRDLIDNLVRERKRGGPFLSFHQFMMRVKVEFSQMRLLIQAGCFDKVAGELTRPSLLWRALPTRHNGGHRASTLYDSGEATVTRQALPIPDDYTEGRKVADELTCFGFPVRCHPLQLHGPARERVRPICAAAISRYVGNEVTLVGILLTEKPAETKHGEPMEFLTFEDESAMYDATLFPDAYRRYCHLLSQAQAYCIHGLVEECFGTVTVTVRNLERLGA
jgi:error-prone DNA polymerase